MMSSFDQSTVALTVLRSVAQGRLWLPFQSYLHTSSMQHQAETLLTPALRCETQAVQPECVVVQRRWSTQPQPLHSTVQHRVGNTSHCCQAQEVSVDNSNMIAE